MRWALQNRRWLLIITLVNERELEGTRNARGSKWLCQHDRPGTQRPVGARNPRYPEG
ncbi:hypothetical protein BCEP4_2040003 [Burkholderia cepacia]|nr:hypothetical protein BCEP4_2040003 [Burkholderia cepacia]